MEVGARLRQGLAQLGENCLDDLGGRVAQGDGRGPAQAVGAEAAGLHVLRRALLACRDHEGEGARPEASGQVTGVVGHVGAPAAKAVLAAHEPREGLGELAPLDGEDLAVGGVVCGGSAGQAVDGVGGHRKDAATAQNLHRTGDDLGLGGGRIDLDHLLGDDRGGGGQLPLPHGDKHARAVGEVLADLHAGPAACGAGELGRLVEVALKELERHHAAGAERARRQLQDAAEDVEAVRAAVKRQLRLVVLDLGRDLVCQDGRGNVGRVGDQDGERAHEGGVHVGREVGLDDVHGVREPQGLAITSCQVDGDG